MLLYISLHRNAMQYISMHCNAMQIYFTTPQCNAIYFNTLQCNAQRIALQHFLHNPPMHCNRTSSSFKLYSADNQSLMQNAEWTFQLKTSDCPPPSPPLFSNAKFCCNALQYNSTEFGSFKLYFKCILHCTLHNEHIKLKLQIAPSPRFPSAFSPILSPFAECNCFRRLGTNFKPCKCYVTW